jgi:hypothetical protein
MINLVQQKLGRAAIALDLYLFGLSYCLKSVRGLDYGPGMMNGVGLAEAEANTDHLKTLPLRTQLLLVISMCGQSEVLGYLGKHKY